MENQEIIMDTMEEAIELVPEKTGVNFGKVGVAILVTGAVAALGYKCYKLIKEKKARKALEIECDNTVEACDFEDEEFAK